MAPSPRARALIGGRWAISVHGWVIALLITETTALALRTDVGPATKFVLMLVAMLLVAPVLMVASATLFRNRADHPVPLWWVMALGAITWPITLPFRFMAGYEVFGEGASEALASGSVLAAVALLAAQGAVGWPAISLGLASLDAYRRRRAELVDQAVRQEAARLRDIGAITALRAAAMEDIGREIGPEMERAAVAAAAAAAEDSGADLPALADMLRDTASGVVRPRSHDLWRSASTGMPRVRTRLVLGRALRQNPLPTLATMTTFTVVFLTGAIIRAGWPFLPTAAACVAAATLIYAAGRRAIRSLPAHTTAIGAATIVLASVAVGVALRFTWDTASWRLATFTGTMFIICALATTAAVTTLRAGEEVIDELADLVDQRAVEQAALRREVVALDRELASHLHGTVQARLVAAAYALREADRTGDHDAARHAAAAAQAALADAMATPVAPLPAGTPVDLRADITAQWGDVLAITWSAPPGALSPDAAHSAAQVLGHALKNAVVHGGAAAADIAVSRAAGDVLIVVTDDGSGPSGGAPGMGSAYLDAVATEWSLAPGMQGGTVLRALLAPPADTTAG